LETESDDDKPSKKKGEGRKECSLKREITS